MCFRMITLLLHYQYYICHHQKYNQHFPKSASQVNDSEVAPMGHEADPINFLAGVQDQCYLYLPLQLKLCPQTQGLHYPGTCLLYNEV